MGYYDGLAPATEEASTYRIAQALNAPVILIVNARGQSLSSLAALEGFVRFRPDSGIKAVIFNQMSEHEHHRFIFSLAELLMLIFALRSASVFLSRLTV